MLGHGPLRLTLWRLHQHRTVGLVFWGQSGETGVMLGWIWGVRQQAPVPFSSFSLVSLLSLCPRPDSGSCSGFGPFDVNIKSFVSFLVSEESAEGGTLLSS